VSTLKINNMDKKDIGIIVLGVLLILTFIFRPSKSIDTYEDEINNLKISNKKLSKNNDSLIIANTILTIEIEKLIANADSTQAALADTEDKINDLENGKGKVSGYVNTLNADGVANALTEYLDKRK